jgi:hypothetical protein
MLLDLINDLTELENREEKPYSEGMLTAYRLVSNTLAARVQALDLAAYLDQPHLRFGEELRPREPEPTLFHYQQLTEHVEQLRETVEAVDRNVCDRVLIAEASDLLAMMDDLNKRKGLIRDL